MAEVHIRTTPRRDAGVSGRTSRWGSVAGRRGHPWRGAKIHNLDRIDPQLQHLSVGDRTGGLRRASGLHERRP